MLIFNVTKFLWNLQNKYEMFHGHKMMHLKCIEAGWVEIMAARLIMLRHCFNKEKSQ